MNKRTEETARAKAAIEEALFALMERKPFSAITVSDIVRESGVARATYYRNYGSKEDVVASFFGHLHAQAGNAFAPDGAPDTAEGARMLMTPDNVAKSLEFYLSKKYYLLLLDEAGFSSLLQDELNRMAEEALGDMPAASVERYRIYMITGAFYNVVMQWLRQGSPEAPAALARELCTAMEGR